MLPYSTIHYTMSEDVHLVVEDSADVLENGWHFNDGLSASLELSGNSKTSTDVSAHLQHGTVRGEGGEG